MQRSPGPIEWRRFHARYTAAQLLPYARRTRALGRALRRRLGHRQILGISLYIRHDQTTLWWFEQSLLAVLAAAGWDVIWITDTTFAFDQRRLDALPGKLRIIHTPPGRPPELPGGRFDAVVSLFPHDLATAAANERGLPLVAFAIKSILATLPPLQVQPAPGTRLWHAFAGSKSFVDSWSHIAPPGVWTLVGAPFPVCRYYAPLVPTPLDIDVLLLGSNGRDYPTVFRAMSALELGRVAAITNPEDTAAVATAARTAGLDMDVRGPQPHMDYVALLERCRVIVNPILPPAESHYSLGMPLAVGRPIITHQIPSVAPFIGPGVRAVEVGDLDGWRSAISEVLAATAEGGPHAGAVDQCERRHGMEKFFASALLQTLSEPRATDTR